MSLDTKNLRVGQQVWAKASDIHCGICKKNIMMPMLVAIIEGNSAQLKALDIPEKCRYCGASKPYLYSWELGIGTKPC